MLLEIIGGLFAVCVSYIVIRAPKTCNVYGKFHIYNLRSKINEQVYGQHIASELVPEALDRYFATHEEEWFPPLILSFHGGSGVGKNYMTKIISDFFPYKKTIIFTAQSDFPHDDLAYHYREVVENRILSTVSVCHVNIIIFDEVERISPITMTGLFNSLNRISSSKTPVIVLLLSNSKSQDINSMVFNSAERKRLTQNNFEFSRNDDMWTDYEIVFVPFLPLEKSHVINCIKSDLQSKGKLPSEKIISDVVEELTFQSRNGKDYSPNGCKRVSDKVDFVIV